MRKNHGLEKKKKINKIVFSHLGGSVSLPGVRESGRISGRLPDNPGGFTCMTTSLETLQELFFLPSKHLALSVDHKTLRNH